MLGATSVLLPDQPYVPEQALLNIKRGAVAVLPNWAPESLASALYEDASSMRSHELLVKGGEGTYTTERRKDFEGTRLLASKMLWNDARVGNPECRREFDRRLCETRLELAHGLQRKTLAGDEAGQHQTVFYTAFRPGSSIGRHFDEHHEELKSRAGWTRPWRRSITWLFYLNKDWDLESDGGALRVYQRQAKLAEDGGGVGEDNGFLQVGWRRDPSGTERPVYMDFRREAYRCALYYNEGGNRHYTTPDFRVPSAMPGLELRRFISDDTEASRFRGLSEPRPVPLEQLEQTAMYTEPPKTEEFSVDISPSAGTLVLFDSVITPHRVREVKSGRDRLTISGWFNEDLPSYEA